MDVNPKKTCAGCSNGFDKNSFSKNQWKSKVGRTCKRCVAGEKPAYVSLVKPVEAAKPKAKAPKKKEEKKTSGKAAAPAARASDSGVESNGASSEKGVLTVGAKTPEEAAKSPIGKGEFELEVAVTAGNCKRMDPKAYGVKRRDAWVKLELDGHKCKTLEINCPTLDPVWEEVFVLKFSDLEKQLKATFYLGDLQIGMPAEYRLGSLIKGKHQYKGLAVMGGKVDLTLRALNFGADEESEEEDDSFFAMM